MRLNSRPNSPLRITLAMLGVAVVLLGFNVGFGGIRTLGWQGGQVEFLSVTDPAVFAIRDSHVRFIGGVWLALGLIMLAGSVAFAQLRQVLVALTVMIFIGGLARLSSGNPALLFSASLAPSFLFEILAVPLLGLWFSKAERPALSGR